MSREKILIVENESIVAEDVKQILERFGYPVVGKVSTGEEALLTAEETHPDLVLMDIMLEGAHDGIETAEQLKNRLRVPVIYLTAYAEDSTLERAKKTEPFGFLVKPFEERELHSTIEMALYKHRMERKLRESEEWLSTTLQSIGDAVIAADTEGTITFINKAAQELTGFAKEEACGKRVEDVLRLVDQQTHAVPENLARKSMTEGTVNTLKEPLTLVAKDGREIPIDDSAAPIKDEHGTVQGAVVVFHDFTERKRMEDELRKTNAFLRGILESSSSISIMSTDLEGTILYWNSGAERLFGYSADELVGRQNIGILYPGDEPETTLAVKEMKDSVFSEKKSVHREIREVTKDGRKVWISITATPQFDDKGNVIGALGIGEDITERKLAEDDRGRLIKDLQEALANVKTLSGLLPICASCKKVRDDKGYWNQIEAYIQEHSDASFSHSICPECMEKYYGDYLHKKKT